MGKKDKSQIVEEDNSLIKPEASAPRIDTSK